MKTYDKKLRLDIACGKNKKPGFTGVDIWEGAEIVADLEKFPWPFEDNSVDEIFCSHYIEHTPDLISFANELYRILKVGATAEIIAPYYSSIRAWQDPTHLRAISENTFLYFNRDWRLINKLDHYPIVSDFDFESSYVLDPAWRDKSDDELKFAIKHYINIVMDIRTVLTKKKPYNDTFEMQSLKASELWNSGQYDEAERICDALATRGEAGLDEYLMIADYAFKMGDFKKAADTYQVVLKVDSDSFSAHVGLLRALGKAGHTEKARRHLERIKKTDAEFADLITDFINTESVDIVDGVRSEQTGGVSCGYASHQTIAAIKAHLKDEYSKACDSKSDISMHLPTLYAYAKKCGHVTEMGSRTGVSTRAFLYANPDTFVSYDYQYATPEPHLAEGVQILKTLFDQCRQVGMNCRYIGKNVLDVEIEGTDLLFIDTYHCYAQLKKELELHAGKVRKYIAFHDTTMFGAVGEGFPGMDPNHPVHKAPMDGSGGIRPAIDEFLNAHKEWKVVHESADSNGLMVISRKQQRRSKADHA